LRDTPIVIYTDGSCNPTSGIGGWAATIQLDTDKITLSGSAKNTTHQRMELLAVIKAIEFLIKRDLHAQPIVLYTDSQYVVGLPARRIKFIARKFMTSSNLPIRNNDLVIALTAYFEEMNITLTKLKSHQNSEVGNQEVDRLSRRIVRQMAVKEK
jgi:ribonuclease HI